MRATKSERCRPYLATTGLRTSVTGLVGFAFRPTERFIGTKSSLENEKNRILHFSYDPVAAARMVIKVSRHLEPPLLPLPEQSAFF